MSARGINKVILVGVRRRSAVFYGVLHEKQHGLVV